MILFCFSIVAKQKQRPRLGVYINKLSFQLTSLETQYDFILLQYCC
jgi:hypothetical protein